MRRAIARSVKYLILIMNQLTKKLFILILTLIMGSCFGIYSIQAQNNELILDISKECDIQYTGDSCIAELKLINNTDKVLDGEAILHIDYRGTCSNNELENFDGEGVRAQFSNNDKWLNLSGWEDGMAMASGFDIVKGETQAKLKIETVSNLCPGNYTFTLTLKGTTETGEEYKTTPTIVGGGGGGLFATSAISGESIRTAEIKENSVIIKWLTNYFSTSRVVYDNISYPVLGNSPNYGYANSTDEDSTKVTGHTVIITGLTPDTTYFYRCVSHASPPTISREHSFTTLALSEEELKKIKEFEEEIISTEAGEEIEEEIEEVGVPEGEKEREGGLALEGLTEQGLTEEIERLREELEKLEQEKGGEQEGEEEVAEKGFTKTFLAGIGTFISDLGDWKILLIIVVLVIIGLIILWLIKKKKKEAETI